MSQLFPAMTPDVMATLIRAARRRRFERRGAWRNAINNFRPANPAKSADVSCVVSTSDAAARVEGQGGATSASALADSAVGARRLTPG